MLQCSTFLRWWDDAYILTTLLSCFHTWIIILRWRSPPEGLRVWRCMFGCGPLTLLAPSYHLQINFVWIWDQGMMMHLYMCEWQWEDVFRKWTYLHLFIIHWIFNVEWTIECDTIPYFCLVPPELCRWIYQQPRLDKTTGSVQFVHTWTRFTRKHTGREHFVIKNN